MCCVVQSLRSQPFFTKVDVTGHAARRVAASLIRLLSNRSKAAIDHGPEGPCAERKAGRVGCRATWERERKIKSMKEEDIW